jgi:hypothetical protein
VILTSNFGKYMTFPIHFRSHLQRNPLPIERMLNIKRFLRLDSLHHTAPIHSRMDSAERWRDRFSTCFRKLVSPVFNVITYDTLKEYRVFSRKIFRLRPDRVIRGHLEAIETYRRLIQDEESFPFASGAMRESQIAAVKVLELVLGVCGKEGLTCWLWLGSLLGAIRNGTFPYMDKEGVLLMPRADYERFRPLCNAFPYAPDGSGELRAELEFRYGGLVTVVKTEGLPRVIVIPCDSCPDNWDRSIYARHMTNATNRAAIASLQAENDVEGLYRHFATLRERMGIGLESDKSSSIFPGWDCPELFEQCHVLATKYYTPSAKRVFEGLEVPVPADHDIVLTAIYGDYLYPTFPHPKPRPET